MYAKAPEADSWNRITPDEKKTAVQGLILEKRELKNRWRYFIKALLVIY